MQKIIDRISQELAARPEQVTAAVRLLDHDGRPTDRIGT